MRANVGRGKFNKGLRLDDGSYALTIVNSGLHYHRYTTVTNTSNFDEKTQTQMYMERCKCGVYNVVYTRFDRSGNRITPRSKKYWFNAEGKLVNETGDLILDLDKDIKP